MVNYKLGPTRSIIYDYQTERNPVRNVKFNDEDNKKYK